MASTSLNYKAGDSAVWAAVVQTVTAAGYTVGSMDAAAKQIDFTVSGGLTAWPQHVTVSVTATSPDEAMAFIQVQRVKDYSISEGGQQREILGFLTKALDARFARSAPQPGIEIQKPPGGGCLVVIGMIAGSTLAISKAVHWAMS